jgi:hypothetical protein
LVETKSSNAAAKSTIMMDTPAAAATLVRERMAMIVVVCVRVCISMRAVQWIGASVL